VASVCRGVLKALPLCVSLLALPLIHCATEPKQPAKKPAAQAQKKDSVAPLVPMPAGFDSIAVREKPDSVRPRPLLPKPAAPKARKVGFTSVTSYRQFEALIDSSKNELIVFELHADWCMPCRILAPVMEQLARQYAGRALFYKVDTDRLPVITRFFAVRGIPFVGLVKGGKTVYAMEGLRPKEAYAQAIEKYSPSPKTQPARKSDSTTQQ